MNEALQCYDNYYAAVMSGLVNKIRPDLPEKYDSIVESADLIAHRMVLARYKRMVRSREKNDGIDYLEDD